MSPEELTQAKKAATIEPRDNIDWFYQETIQNQCAHVDAQAAQIEALKEKLVEERSIRLFRADSKDIFSMWTLQSKEIQDEYKRDARQQLADDHELQDAGVTWE